MSFNINRDENNVIIKDPPVYGLGAVVNNSNSLGLSNANIYNASVESVTSNSGPLTINQTNLNYLSSVNAGISSGGKALILDSNKNINNINTINCKQITVNGNILPTSSGTGTANTFLSKAIPGSAVSKAALVTDNSNNISGINTLGANTVSGDNYTLKSSKYSTVFNFSSINRISDNSDKWNDIVWSPDLLMYVCVGSSGKILYSIDGANTWTTVDIAEIASSLKRIIWIDYLGLFIAIGNNTVVTSSDGKVWISRTVPSGTYNSIASGNGKIVVVGNNVAIYSTNGINWSSSTLSTSRNWIGLCYGNGLFLACGTISLMSSVDGVNWVIDITTFTSTFSFVDAVFGDTGFTVISSTTSNSYKLVQSFNGTSNWTYRDGSWLSSMFSGVSFRRIYYINQLKRYIILAQDKANSLTYSMYTSVNSTDWEPVSSNSKNYFSAIAWSSYYGNIVSLSANYDSEVNNISNLFTNLNSVYLPTVFNGSSNNIGAITNGKIFGDDINSHLFVAASGRFNYSLDGTKFSNCIVNGSVINSVDVLPRCVTYSPTLGIYVAGSTYHSTSNIKTLWYSTNGINWMYSNYGGILTINDVKWIPFLSKFIAVGPSSTLFTSSNGIDWTTSLITSPGIISLIRIFLFSNNKIIVSNNTNSDLYSTTDGITWTLNGSTPGVIADMCYSPNNGYVAVSNSTVSLYSSMDSITWVTISSPTNVGILGVIFNPYLNLFIAYNNSGTAYYSSNSSTWNSVTQPNTTNINIRPYYSERYNCIFLGHTATYVISKTMSFANIICKGESLYSASTKSYRFLNIKKNKFIMEDRIKTGFLNGSTMTSIDSYTPTKLCYSEFNNQVYVGCSNSTSGFIYTNNNFTTISATVPATGTLTGLAIFCDIKEYNGSVYVVLTSNSTSNTNFLVRVVSATTLTYNHVNSYISSYSSLPTKCLIPFDQCCYVLVGYNLYKFYGYGSSSSMNINNLNSNNNVKYMAIGNGTISIIGNNIAFYVDVKTDVVSPTTITGNYNYITYGLKKFIAVGAGVIAYSSNGIDWNYSTFSSSNTWSCVKFIESIGCFIAIASAGTDFRVIYSFDGINWNFIPISVTNSWIDITFSESYKTFILLGTTSPKIFISKPLFMTPYNKIQNTNSLSNGFDKVSLITNSTILETELTHSLQLNGSIKTVSSIGTSTMLSNSGRLYLTYLQSKYVNISNHNGTTTGLSLAGTLVNATAKDINELLYVSSSKYVKNNSLLSTDNNGNIKTIKMSASDINITNNIITEGVANTYKPIVTDSDNNISNLNSIQTNKLIVNNSELYGSSKKNNTKILNYTDLFNFKLSEIAPGGGSILGCDYSDDLDIVVFLLHDGTNVYGVYSKNRGESWSTTDIIMASTSNANIKWSISAKCFLVHQISGSNAISYSYNGLDWTASVLPVACAVLFNDIKNNRTISISTNNASYFCTGDPSNWTLLGTATIGSQLRYGYSITPSNILYIDIPVTTAPLYSSNTNISVITLGAYSTGATYPAVIYGISWHPTQNVFYIISGKIIYKTTSLATLGTAVYTDPGTPVFINLIIIPELNNLIVARTHNYMVYSMDGITWRSVCYPGACQTNFIVNRIFFKDRFILLGLNISTNGYNIMYSNFYEKNENSLSVNYLQDKYLDSKNMPSSSYNSVTPTLGYKRVTLSFSSKLIGYAEGINYNLGVAKNFVFYNSIGISTTLNQAVTGDWKSVIFGNDKFSLCGTDIVGYTTSTSMPPTIVTSTYTGNWTGIAYGVNKFIMSSKDGKIATSEDGITWSSTNLTGIWNNVIYTKGYFILCGLDYLATSINGVDWNVIPLTGLWFSAVYGNGKFILTGAFTSAYSYDLISWRKKEQPGHNMTSVIYCKHLLCYIATSAVTNNYSTILYSANGTDWNNNSTDNAGYAFNQGGGAGEFFTFIHYSEKYSILVILGDKTNGNYNYQFVSFIGQTKYNRPIVTPDVISNVDPTPGTNANAIIIGNSNLAAPPALFSVMVDSAAKPGTSTWSVTSDERLKENIVDADLDMCYNTIDSLDLKRFKWKDEFIGTYEVDDKHKLGWIAQEVEQLIPKAVKKINSNGYEDCRTLDNDQIIANMYGAVKKLINLTEEKEQKIKLLEDKQKFLEEELNSFEVVEE